MSDGTQETPRPATDATTVRSPIVEDTRSVPARFGRYEVRGEVARGGMGIVYRAYDPQLDREVALKVMLGDEFWAADTQVDRFLREARAAARLHHPNLIGVHDVGRAEGKHYFTMELIDGESLAARLHRQGALPVREAAEMAHLLARAMHYAHGQGLVHRDLKPSNVLLSKDGRVLITDFGLAKEMEGPANLTRSGQIVGTPAYMSPEQAEGRSREVDARTDVYALGAVLYELLTALPPFSAESTVDLLKRIREDDPRPVRAIRADVPADIQTVVAKAMEKPRERRYPSALALAQDLERFLAGEPIVARPSRWASRLWRKARRNRAAFALMVVLAVLLLGGIAWLGGGEVRRRVLLGRATGQAREAIASTRYDEAISAAEEAARLAPSDESVMTLLARARAEKRAAAGKAAMEEYRGLSEQAASLQAEASKIGAELRAAEEAGALKTHADKGVLWDAQERLSRTRTLRQEKWVEAVTAYTQAYGLWNRHEGAIDALADLYWEKYAEAEQARDASGMATYGGLVLQFGRERYEGRIHYVGSIGVTFALPSAFHGTAVEAYLYRYDQISRPPVLVPVPCDPTGQPLSGPSIASCEPVPLARAAMPEEEVDALQQEADRLRCAGKPLEAIPLYTEVENVRPGSAQVALALARSFAQADDPGTVAEWIARAIRRGFTDADALERDKDLASVRSDTRVAAMIAVLRGNLPPRNVLIVSVTTDPPAADVAVKPWDVLLALDGAPVRDAASSLADLQARKAGTTLRLRVWRGEEREVEVRLGQVTGLDLVDDDVGPLRVTEPDPGGDAHKARQGSVFPLERAERNRITMPVREGKARLTMKLPRGSYLLWIPSQGDSPTASCRYPFVVAPDLDWSDERADVPLAEDVPPGFLYVPSGPYFASGDPAAVQVESRAAGTVRVEEFYIARHETLVWEYLRFLNDRAFHDAKMAWSRAPRDSMQATKESVYGGQDEGTGVILIQPKWRADWPVGSVSERDAEAFAEWCTRMQGGGRWRFRLPTEDEWEKAARGTDGRAFPWGEGEDASFCEMSESRRTERKEAACEPWGLFPLDEGPYGARDMAGGVREWIAPAAGASLAVVKGGDWGMPMGDCRAASRSVNHTSTVASNWGFRLAADRVGR